MIESPVLTRVKVDFKGFGAYDVEPVAIPDVLAERPVVVFGKWRGEAKGRVTLSGITGEGKYTDSIDVAGVKPLASNAALQYLWARHRITLLSDYNKLRTTDKRVQEVTDLGLKYNLLTAYTSFIAVDTEIRNKGGESTTVQQPLPLPQGVSDYAVGSGGVPMASMAPMAPAGRGMAYDMAAPTKMAREEVRQKSDAKKASTSNVVQATVTGGLSKGDVLAVAQAHLKEVEQCAQGITGKMVIELTVAPDGTVKEAKDRVRCGKGKRRRAVSHPGGKEVGLPGCKGRCPDEGDDYLRSFIAELTPDMLPGPSRDGPGISFQAICPTWPSRRPRRPRQANPRQQPA